MAGLNIPIGADITDLENQISVAERQLRTLEQRRETRVRLGMDTSNIDQRLSAVNSNLNTLRNNLNSTTPSLTNFNRQAGNGGNTLMQFSRIAQDAPFGIMGIGNNLTATAEAFSHLSRTSGGAGNALRSVASSLLGSGGILLAVSLVTTALTIMSQNGITVGDVFDKLTGQFDETANSIKKIGQEATKTAGEEISSINSYLSVAKNRELSDKQRLLAVKQLQDAYPAYFGNLTKEQILNGKVGDAVRDVSKALRERAIASALDGKLGEQAVKRLELEEKREKAILFIQQSQKALKDKINGNGSIFTNEEGQLEMAGKLYKSVVKDILALDAVSKKYSDRASKATEKSIDLLQEEEKAAGKAKTKKVKLPNNTPQTPELDVLLKPIGLADTSNVGLNNGTKDQFGNQNQSFGGAEFAIANIKATTQAVSEETALMQELMLGFNENMNNIISDSIASTFMNLGSVIGEAFANGGNALEAAGGALLGDIGGLLSAMGGELIKLGTAAILAGTVTKTFGSILGIGAGIAAIAGGTLLSAAGSAISSKANKSVSGYDGQGGGLSTGANYSTPNTSNYGTSSSSGGTVVFEISGQSLIGVLSNTLDKNSRLGGSLSIGN
jgi:hypothetical protein